MLTIKGGKSPTALCCKKHQITSFESPYMCFMSHSYQVLRTAQDPHIPSLSSSHRKIKIADIANSICDNGNGKVRQDGHCIVIGLYSTLLTLIKKIKKAEPYS